MAAASALPDPLALDRDYWAAPVLPQLPRGRHNLSREFVERNQRYRLLGAAIEAACERGYAATTVSDITCHAAVSRRTFYEHFSGKEDCFLAAYDVALEWLFDSVAASLDPDADWASAVAAAVERVLHLLAADPRLARLGTVEIFLAGPAAVSRHEALVERLAGLLRRGRAESPEGVLLPPQLEEALLGGALFLVARYVHSGEADLLPDLTPVVTELIRRPYGASEPLPW